MANAVTWWSSESGSNDALPSHFAPHALGTPRSTRRTSDVVIPIAIVAPISEPIAEPVTSTTTELSAQDARLAPTVRARKTTFRLGAKTEAKSSLAIFVLIGFAVGLFAFAMMSFCLPDPGEEIAARAAKREQLAAMMPAAAPEAAPMPVTPMAAPATQDLSATEVAPAPTTTLTAKTPHAHRRASKTKKASLPSNPYFPAGAL